MCVRHLQVIVLILAQKYSCQIYIIQATRSQNLDILYRSLIMFVKNPAKSFHFVH